MRHAVKGRKLASDASHQKAMMKNLVRSLMDKQKITTTLARAKEVRSDAEKVITLGKKGTLSARRQAIKVLGNKELTHKVFTEYAERFKDRPGGYTRIIKAGYRKGDNAPIAILELVD